MNGKSAKMYLASDRVFITKRMGRHLANQTVRLAVRQQPDPITEETYRSGQRSLCHIPAAGVAVAARSLTGSVPWSSSFAHTRSDLGWLWWSVLADWGHAVMRRPTDCYDTMVASVRASSGRSLWDGV